MAPPRPGDATGLYEMIQEHADFELPYEEPPSTLEGWGDFAESFMVVAGFLIAWWINTSP